MVVTLAVGPQQQLLLLCFFSGKYLIAIKLPVPSALLTCNCVVDVLMIKIEFELCLKKKQNIYRTSCKDKQRKRLTTIKNDNEE
jgi:hypothetical protein